MMRIPQILLCVMLLLCLCLVAESRAGVPPLELEVEIERGKEVSRLSVFVRNNTSEPVQFPNGARGGSGSLIDSPRGDMLSDRKWILGSAPTVVPKIDFRYARVEHGFVTLVAPVFGGPTRRSMRAYFVEVPAKSRILYSSFVVPNFYTDGGFVQARMKVNPKQLVGKTGKIELKLLTTKIVEKKKDKESSQQPAELDKK